MLKTTISQLKTLYPPVGLGGEKLWFCPSLRTDGHEITGSATNETFIGSMVIISDKQSGGSLAYRIPDGSTGGLEFTPSASTIASGQAASLTVALWAKHTRFDTIYLFSLGKNTFDDYLLITGTSNDFIKGNLDNAISGGNVQFKRGKPMQHYVFEFTSTSIKTWVNGVLADTTTGTWAGETWDRGGIGLLRRFSSGPGNECTLDDIRVYGRTLSQTEISHLATARGIQGDGKTRLKARYNEPAGVFIAPSGEIPRTRTLLGIGS
jgi:hypothetical protein